MLLQTLQKTHPCSSLQSYLATMSESGKFADDLIISAAAMKYGRPIHMFHSPCSSPIIYDPNSAESLEGVGITPLYMANVSVNFGFSSVSDGEKDHFISLIETSG